MFKLNSTIGKTMLVFFLSAFLGGIAATIEAGMIPTFTQIKVAAISGVSGAMAYLVKAFVGGTTDAPASDLFKLNWRDIGKTVAMLFISTVIAALGAAFTNGRFPNVVEIKVAVLSGVSVALGYLLKNVFTNSSGVPTLKKE